MKSKISRALSRIFTALTMAALLAAGLVAQDDPDPNSPIPILLSHDGSTQALAQTRREASRGLPLRVAPRAFDVGQSVVLYAINLQPMAGEGPNAYRVYAVDKDNRQFRFPVLDVELIPNSRNVYAVTILIDDQIQFWAPPEANGNVSIYLAVRGMASNRVLLPIGQTTGGVKEEAGARPTPWGTTAESYFGRTQGGITPRTVGYRFAGDRKRFLEQATFGPTATLDNRIRRIGIRAWLDEQFEMPYPTNPYPSNPLMPVNAPSNCDGGADDSPVNCGRDTYTMYQPQTWFFREAFYGDAQLRHRVAWALNQIWVTAFPEVQQGRHMVEYHKVLSNNAFGNYRELMEQMTLNPAMGQYLDMAISTRTNPNENYAREIMQLFAIGLFMLNPDGTLQLDANGDPIPTYTQDGVNNLTKVLTGWTFCSQTTPIPPATTSPCPNIVAGTINYIDPLLFNNNVTTINGNRHDLTAKTLLSYPGSQATMNIAACGTGCQTPTPTATALANIRVYANNSLEQALDNLFQHPNVGPFVGKILIQHLVTSDPTPAYVERVASVFNNNGAGVRGDMKAVVRAILLDPEARGDVKTDPNFGKLREPVLLFTNFARAFGVRNAAGNGQSDGNVTRGRAEFNNMAQIPYQPPTVFNFYPPDYGIPGVGILGPEFAIMTTGTAIARATFINRCTFVNNPAGNPPYPVPFPVANPDTPSGTSFNFSDLVALSSSDTTGGKLVDELNRRLLHGTMSSEMRSSILTAVNAYGTTATAHESRVRQAVYLVATSSQFQVQR